MRVQVGSYRYSPGWILFVAAALGIGALGTVAAKVMYEAGERQR